MTAAAVGRAGSPLCITLQFRSSSQARPRPSRETNGAGRRHQQHRVTHPSRRTGRSHGIHHLLSTWCIAQRTLRSHCCPEVLRLDPRGPWVPARPMHACTHKSMPQPPQTSEPPQQSHGHYQAGPHLARLLRHFRPFPHQSTSGPAVAAVATTALMRRWLLPLPAKPPLVAPVSPWRRRASCHQTAQPRCRIRAQAATKRIHQRPLHGLPAAHRRTLLHQPTQRRLLSAPGLHHLRHKQHCSELEITKGKTSFIDSFSKFFS